MRSSKLTKASVLVVTFGALAATSTGGAAAQAAGSGCGHDQAVCSTLAPYGANSFVLKVYAPDNTTITAFDIWTGKKPTALRPRAICKSHGSASGADYQLADYAVTRCTETIKAKHFKVYCFTGGGGIPFLSGPSINRIHIDAGDAGADDVKMVSKTTKCPAGVATRKAAKKRRG